MTKTKTNKQNETIGATSLSVNGEMSTYVRESLRSRPWCGSDSLEAVSEGDQPGWHGAGLPQRQLLALSHCSYSRVMLVDFLPRQQSPSSGLCFRHTKDFPLVQLSKQKREKAPSVSSVTPADFSGPPISPVPSKVSSLIAEQISVGFFLHKYY